MPNQLPPAQGVHCSGVNAALSQPGGACCPPLVVGGGLARASPVALFVGVFLGVLVLLTVTKRSKTEDNPLFKPPFKRP